MIPAAFISNGSNVIVSFLGVSGPAPILMFSVSHVAPTSLD